MVAEKGRGGYLLSLIMFAIPIIILSNFFLNLLPKDLRFWTVLITGVPACLFIGAEALTGQIELKKDSIYWKSMFRERELRWSEVSSIMRGSSVAVMPVEVASFFVMGHDKNMKIGVPVSSLKNGAKFTEATIKAATSANPKIRIDSELLKPYGRFVYTGESDSDIRR